MFVLEHDAVLQSPAHEVTARVRHECVNFDGRSGEIAFDCLQQVVDALAGFGGHGNHVALAAHQPLEHDRISGIDFVHDDELGDPRGLDLGKTLDALLPHTAFIHVKDALGDVAKFQFALPGEGTIDYADYFRRLKASNWAGSVCVEVSGQVFGKPGYDPIAAAKKCYAALAPAFRAAGL